MSESNKSINGLLYDPENYPVGTYIEYEYGLGTYFYRGEIVGVEAFDFVGIKTVLLFLRVDEIISTHSKERKEEKQVNPFIRKIKLVYHKPRVKIINKKQ